MGGGRGNDSIRKYFTRTIREIWNNSTKIQLLQYKSCWLFCVNFATYMAKKRSNCCFVAFIAKSIRPIRIRGSFTDKISVPGRYKSCKGGRKATKPTPLTPDHHFGSQLRNVVSVNGILHARKWKEEKRGKSVKKNQFRSLGPQVNTNVCWGEQKRGGEGIINYNSCHRLTFKKKIPKTPHLLTAWKKAKSNLSPRVGNPFTSCNAILKSEDFRPLSCPLILMRG